MEINTFTADAARIQAAEAQAKADAYAVEHAKPLLDYIYAEIQKIAAKGGGRFFTWLDETDEARWAEGIGPDGDYPIDRHVCTQVALQGHTLLERPAGPSKMRPTRLGRALLKHLQDAGYRASLNSFPGGQLVIQWGPDDDDC